MNGIEERIENLKSLPIAREGRDGLVAMVRELSASVDGQVGELETRHRAIEVLRRAIESALACGCDGDWQSAEKELRAAINKPACERCGGREWCYWMTTSEGRQERGEYPCPVCCPIDYAEHKRTNP